MFAKTVGAGILGLNGVMISVEVDISNGIPALDIVGLPDAAVRESKERVKAAIRNSGFEFPCRRITVNLAPADVKKDGSGFDLPIAVGILAASGYLGEIDLSGIVLVGELSLDGRLRQVPGALPMAIMCCAEKIPRMMTPAGNAAEASIVGSVSVIAVDSLTMALSALRGDTAGLAIDHSDCSLGITGEQDDFRDVQGQFTAKRALEIAAAGSHNVLLSGPPGAGKTMLARRIPSILPAMTMEEALEVSKIASVAGIAGLAGGLVKVRPFRSPHHTVSAAAMAGGGRIPRPGEVTLAHHGVLFLDELPEFPRQVLEVLRQPIEDGKVTVARVNSSYTYPSRIMLVAGMNPCPCGFFGDPLHECTCTDAEIKRYLRRISGPLLDRIDMHIAVPRLKYEEMISTGSVEPSTAIAYRVAEARLRQSRRLSGTGAFSNAQMSHRHLRKLCRIDSSAQELLRQAFEKMHLNARSYDRIIKVAQTIADLAAADSIGFSHMAEAIQLRLSLTETGQGKMN